MKRSPWDSKERKFVLPKGSQFDTSLLPVIQNLTAQGLTEADIGRIVGFQGAEAASWLSHLKQRNDMVHDAAEVGYRMADAALVAQMYRAAVGYDYEEVEENYGIDKLTGEWGLKGKKVKTKHQPPNPQLAIFLAVNHMPDLYKNRVETTKNGFQIHASTELSAEQIAGLAGKLMDESRKRKQIDSTVVETDNE